jgi:flavin-binding protein dodecin
VTTIDAAVARAFDAVDPIVAARLDEFDRALDAAHVDHDVRATLHVCFQAAWFAARLDVTARLRATLGDVVH